MKEFKKFGKFLVLGFGVLAFVMLLLKGGVVLKTGFGTAASDNSTISLIFGTDNVDFSFIGFLGLLLLVLGAIASFVKPLGKFKSLVGALLLLVSAVLFFIYPTSISEHITFSLGTPLVLATVFAALGGLASGLLGFLEIK